MAQQIIFRGTVPNDQTGDTAYVFTGKINQMFGELYGISALPIKFTNQSGDFTLSIPADTWIEQIFVTPQTGTPDIKIGTSLHGNEILDTTLIGNYIPVQVQLYFTNSATIYFEASGGNVNIRVDIITNFK
jgi:hypothetical protein